MTPSFNQGRFLGQAMTSVLEQGYPNLEYIVVDGGSTDKSVEVIRRFAPRLAYWVSEKDGGQADAIAKGFSRTTGEILGWLNSDDVLLPGSLARVAREFWRHAEVGLVYGTRDYIDADGAVLSSYSPPSILGRWYFAFGQWIPQECAFWRKDLYDAVGGIDSSLFFSIDFSLFVRMWSLGQFRRLPVKLGAMRLHKDSKTNKAGHIMVMEGDRVRAANGILRIRNRVVHRLFERAIYAQASVERVFDSLRSPLDDG